MNCSFIALPRLSRHCALFTYYLANHRMVSYLLNSIFNLKEQTICNVYSIMPEAWNIQCCKCFTVLWHTRGETADMEEYSCSGNRVAILDYFNRGSRFLVMIQIILTLFFAISRFNS